MESIKELRKICQNPKKYHNSGSFWDNKLWRVFSIYITKALLYTPLKPDHITFTMIFWGFLVGFLFSFGTYWYMLIGAITLIFLYILDAVDGEMARYKRISSLNGAFLDIVSHSTDMAVPFIGLTIGIYRFNPSIYILLAGLSACVFSVLCLNIQLMKHQAIFKEIIKYSQKTEKIKSKNILRMTQGITKESKIKSAMKIANYFYDQQHSMYLFLLAALFGKLHLLLLFYGLTFPLVWLIKLFYEYKIGYEPYNHLLNPYKR